MYIINLSSYTSQRLFDCLFFQVSKTVGIDNSDTSGYSRSENSLFIAFHRPTKATVLQTNGDTIAKTASHVSDAQHETRAFHSNHQSGSTVLQSPSVQPKEVVLSHESTIAHVQNACQNDIDVSDDDDKEVTDIMEHVRPRHPLNRSRETTVTHAQKSYDEDSDEDSEVAEIMANAESKKYPVLGYRLVRLTPSNDEDENGDDEYDDDVIEGYGNVGRNNDDGYQGDDDDDDYYNDNDSEFDDIQELIQILKKDECQSPRESWLTEVRDTNNSEAGSETMDDVMMSCFRPNTPVVVRPSPTRSTSDHSILSAPSVTDSGLSLLQFSQVIVSSESTVGSIDAFTTSSSPNQSRGTITTELSLDIEDCESKERRNDEDHRDDLLDDAVQVQGSNDLKKDVEERLTNDRVTQSKPLLAVNPSTSLAEFRASVLVGERLSVRRYEEWFTKSEDEQFAEILEDFLEENEGQLFDQENNIREMLANTRDRIAETRKAIREARETNTSLSLSRSSPSDESIETDGDDAARGNSSDESIETDGDDAGESSSERHLVDEPVSAEDRLCGYLTSFFGRRKYLQHCPKTCFDYLQSHDLKVIWKHTPCKLSFVNTSQVKLIIRTGPKYLMPYM